MTKKIIPSMLIAIAWFVVTTFFYKTILLMLLFLVWKKQVFEKLPSWMVRYGMKPYWAVFVICIWVAMPRYRIYSGDRVRLVYLDEEGNAKHPPLGQYLVNTLLPEEEVMNMGVHNYASLAKQMGIGGPIMQQVEGDKANGKIHNYYAPYRHLGLENPMSGVYVQAFNQFLGGNGRAVYICSPKDWSKDKAYPLVVFCHGFLGNWQLYQGIWMDLNNCIVLSIGTHDWSGIFCKDDIDKIFTFYIPALERMDYQIDKQQLHLMGLSNGGSAINAAMHSRHASDFKSITSISCNLKGLRKVPCKVNLIGGGEDNSSRLMPSQAAKLRTMGVDVGLFFDPEENHFILVNQREKILSFLKQRMNLN